MQKTLTIYFDYTWPFCYTETVSLKPLEQKGIELEWKAWELPSDANPPAKPGGYGEDAKLFLGELLKETGLEVNPPSKKRNTVLAHIGGKYAKANGKFNEYHHRVFQAVWVKDEDIENVGVLSHIASEAGLDPKAFKAALNNNEYKELVEADFTSATESKIWTIPSYVGANGVIQVNHFKDMPSVDTLKTIL